MYKTILVPIDLAHAEKCKAMLDLAEKLGGKNPKITLINVVEDVPSYVAAQIPGGLMQKMGKNARTELTGIANAANSNAKVEIRSGSPASGILSAAEDMAANLIIVASHKPGLQDYLLGSTASRIVRHAKCSVLVIR